MSLEIVPKRRARTMSQCNPERPGLPVNLSQVGMDRPMGQTDERLSVFVPEATGHLWVGLGQ